MKMFKGDIFLIDLGKGVGSEQGGIRPCLIMQNNMGNRYAPTTIVVPITSQVKRFNKMHLEINCLGVKSWAMFEQPRTVSKERIIKYLTSVDKEEMIGANGLWMLTIGA